jgi:preprotein translocase subunit SecD
MNKNLRWKVIVILAAVGLAIFAFTPPQQKVKLGLDLKGGVELILQVQTDDALRLETDTSVEQLREALKTAGITVGTLRSTSLTEFVAEGVPQASDAQFRQVAQDNLGLAYDREAGAGGTHTFRMKPNIAVQRRSEAVTQAIQTIDRRVNELGVSEPVVAPSGTAQDRILVQLPGVTDIARAKNIIGSRTLLEIKLVEAGPASDEATLLAPYGGKLPPDMQVLKGAGVDRTDTGTYYYLVNRVAAITGRDLRNARTMVDEIGQPGVLFTLNNEGVSKFTRVTGDNVGRQLAIVLDDFVRSAPSIRERISRADANITGSFSQQEAADLALVLRSGALPASLTYLAESTVGPTLGEESIRAGILASLTGLALVTLFMLVYYRLAGFNAFLAITINLIILLGFMAYLGAAMTLPGIAGFILTIGMGVDSNVLIFERIREELALKKGARQAIAAGFDRVFVTIVDTHVASLIAAAFLFQFGTGPIRGFATTLFFGLITNVFTAVFVSRTLFELTLSRKPAGSAQQLSI